MLKPIRPKSPSQFEGIYDRIIPEDHFLRKFNNLVDLSFISSLQLFEQINIA